MIRFVYETEKKLQVFDIQENTIVINDMNMSFKDNNGFEQTVTLNKKQYKQIKRLSAKPGECDNGFFGCVFTGVIVFIVFVMVVVGGVKSLQSLPEQNMKNVEASQPAVYTVPQTPEEQAQQTKLIQDTFKDNPEFARDVDGLLNSIQ